MAYEKPQRLKLLKLEWIPLARCDQLEVGVPRVIPFKQQHNGAAPGRQRLVWVVRRPEGDCMALDLASGKKYEARLMGGQLYLGRLILCRWH